ncbi:7-cyano-7-deazaguanine synthase [Microcoleus sp. D3_18a_C4]|uniref:7-cyano-7-deazaguanine synthase n=1 Tax=unclassified Microcoleus TaxID=2642155 RepID=UPI00403F00A2
MFLSFGLAGAETLNADRVYISLNALDYSGYRHCRPHYNSSHARSISARGKIGDRTRCTLYFNTAE